MNTTRLSSPQRRILDTLGNGGRLRLSKRYHNYDKYYLTSTSSCRMVDARINRGLLTSDTVGPLDVIYRLAALAVVGDTA